MIDKTQVTKNGIKIIDSTKAANALFDILQTQFPQTIKDGQVSLNAIAKLLGLKSSNMQGYKLTFTGKGLANALYSTPCEKVLQLKESFATTNTPPPKSTSATFQIFQKSHNFTNPHKIPLHYPTLAIRFFFFFVVSLLYEIHKAGVQNAK